MLEAEAHVAAALGGDTGAVSALRVLQLYLERLGRTLLVRACVILCGEQVEGQCLLCTGTPRARLSTAPARHCTDRLTPSLPLPTPSSAPCPSWSRSA